LEDFDGVDDDEPEDLAVLEPEEEVAVETFGDGNVGDTISEPDDDDAVVIEAVDDACKEVPGEEL